MARTISLLMLVVGVTLAAIVTGGCGAISWVPPDVPDVLQRVIDDRATFFFDPNEEVVDPLPGEVVEDPAELDGCWGIARDAGGQIPMNLFQVYHFDAATGAVEIWTLQDPPVWWLPQTLSREVGTLAIEEVDEGEAQLTVTITEVWISDPDTGELAETFEEEAGTELGFVELTRFVKVDGDTLYVQGTYDDGGDTETGDDTWVMVYQRMDCEVEGAG
jgi:hypothetical protein